MKVQEYFSSYMFLESVDGVRTVFLEVIWQCQFKF